MAKHPLTTALGCLAVLGIVVILWLAHHHLTSWEHVDTFVHRYGYVAIIGMTLLGNIGVPIPEETSVLLAGLAAREGLLSYRGVLLVCIISAVVGDNLGYAVGRFGGRPLLRRYGAAIGITKSRLEAAEAFVARHGGLAVFIARFIGGLRFLAGPLSGAAKMPFLRFFTCNLCGAIVWVVIVSQLGYRFGVALLGLVHTFGLYALLLLIMIGIAVWVCRLRRSR